MTDLDRMNDSAATRDERSRGWRARSLSTLRRATSSSEIPSVSAVIATHQSASPSSSVEGIAIERAALQQVLPDVGEHLAGLLGQTGGGVEQSLVVGERAVDRAPRFRLILGERRDVRGRGAHA